MLQKEKEKKRCPLGLSNHVNRLLSDNYVINDFGFIYGSNF